MLQNQWFLHSLRIPSDVLQWPLALDKLQIYVPGHSASEIYHRAHTLDQRLDVVAYTQHGNAVYNRGRGSQWVQLVFVY